MKFHERLKELRLGSMYYQKDIAEIIGVTPVAFRKYEQGAREPSIEKLLKLAVLFNVSLDDLLCLEDYKKSHEESAGES